MPEAQSVAVTMSTDVLLQELNDGNEAVLLNLKNEQYYGLDNIGLRFWKLLVTYGNTNDVVPQLLTEFDVDEATIQRDLTVLLSELEQAELITTSKA